MKRVVTLALSLAFAVCAKAEPLPVVEVEGQPLASNARRLIEALDFLGAPLAADLRATLDAAIENQDAAAIQAALDPLVLCAIEIKPEYRVKAVRGPAKAVLQEAGYTAALLKVVNHGDSTAQLRLGSRQAGPSFAGVAKGTMERQRQTQFLRNENKEGAHRFLDLSIFDAPPMTAKLSGLEVEYAIALIYSSEAGKREAVLDFDIGEGTQDLGFRAEVPVLFEVRPAVAVKLDIADHDGTPTTARLTFTDAQGHVFPPQARRLSPDFFFQKHIYRAHGATVLLPPGEFTVEASRGPEYRTVKQQVKISAETSDLKIHLERWFDAAEHGYYSGDHHIHAAGCAHYTSPDVGMPPQDMFAQVKGEGLNVGCVLTWGYGFEHQRPFFGGDVHPVSEPLTLLRYDIEVSGFGSASLGHVCLLNLRELVYPGAEGTVGWPTWTTPALRWTKAQGGFTGYPHSGSGMQVDAAVATKRMFETFDTNRDARITSKEAEAALLPETFDLIDADRDGGLNEAELTNSHERAIDRLPNLALPDSGGHEIFVSTALGACDFISAMDTARLLEWNAWYHLLNCGFPIACAGETDFPCMSGTRVGQGRSYVQLGRVEKLDFATWCEGMARGRSYVSDGYAHAPGFSVEGVAAGGEVKRDGPGKVTVRTKVAFSSETPLEIAYGTARPVAGARLVGDTVHYHDTTGEEPDPKRRVELVVNGTAVAKWNVEADDRIHEVSATIDIAKSSWVAVRQFPQLHTNPVRVIIDGKPIRASRDSARWCVENIDQLWRTREARIADAEKEEAKAAFEEAKGIYRKIAEEATTK